MAAHNGTCPFPMALSLSTLEATPSATLPTSGSVCHQLLEDPHIVSIWSRLSLLHSPACLSNLPSCPIPCNRLSMEWAIFAWEALDVPIPRWLLASGSWGLSCLISGLADEDCRSVSVSCAVALIQILSLW